MSLTPDIKTGLIGLAREEVSANNTAIAYGSGSVSVYATPGMVGLMERAALSSVDPLLPEGYSTVGIKLEVEHIAATPVGSVVEARSELREMDGRRLIFEVEAHDGTEIIGRGKHERFVIFMEKFLKRVNEKIKPTT